MSNYNKSFNFRNGVQVDEDDLIVRGSLVGIGTTIPRSELDVYGDTNVTGLVTSSNLYVSGIATFTDVRIGAGITIYGNSGIISATFYGDGSNLRGIPTSQWIDINPGTGVTSIYSLGNVGIATTGPTNTLQIGGRVENGDSGVGISSSGNIYASGIVTASSFVGGGSGLTGLNASQITTGTITEDRLPENLNVTGILTAATLQATQINNTGIATISDLKLGQTNISGIATVGFATVSAAYINNFTAGVATATSLTVTGTISASNISGLQSITIPGTASAGLITASNAYVTGVTTTGSLVASSANITNLTATSSTTEYATATNLDVTGIATAASLNASQINSTGIATFSTASITGLNVGVTTSTNFNSGAVRIGYGLTNEIDTFFTDLLLDSAGGTVIVDDNLNVTGIATFENGLRVNTSALPDADLGADLGSSTEYFKRAYVGEVNIGVAASNEITTRSNTLVLDSDAGTVQVDDNLVVTGTTYLTGITTVQDSIVPDVDQNAALGSASLRFSDAYVDNVRIGVGSDNEVSTGSGNLKLDSSSKLVEVADRFKVSGETYLVGVSTVETGLLPDDDKGAYLGSSSKSFSEAYIDEIRIGVGGTNVVDTREGNLVLDSQTSRVVVNNDLTVNQNTTLLGDLVVGDNDLYVNKTTNKIGIGTTVPSNDIEIVRTAALNVELVSETGAATVAIGQSLGIGNSSATVSYSGKNLDISNKDTGNFSFNLHSGSTGINTGNFNWVYGQTNAELLSLTYEGKLGLGITNPTNDFHVVGTSTVTDNAWFGSNVSVSGDLTFGGSLNGNIVLPTIIDGSNINVVTGVSTFTNIETTGNIIVGSGVSIGIGTDAPIVELDAREVDSMFGSISVGTGQTANTGDLVADGSVIASGVGIGTTNALQQLSVYGNVEIYPQDIPGAQVAYVTGTNLELVLNNKSTIGVGTTGSIASVDFRLAGKGINGGAASFMIPPTVTTSERVGLNTAGKEGALIFNSTTKKFQGYDGTTWHDLH